MPLLGPLLGFLVGLSLGTLGGGGSTLAVPIFLYAYGYEIKPAIAMGLAVVGATAGAGALVHARAGNFHRRAALTFGPVSMAGAWLGTRLGLVSPAGLQLGLFAGLMLVAGVLMLRPRAEIRTGSEPPHAPILLIAAVGFMVGILTGLLGMGGGFLIVPALVLLLGLPMKPAVGTSLVIIALNSLTGFLGYARHVSIDWRGMGVFMVLALAGVVVGTRLVRRLPQARLRQLFGLFLIGVATFMLIER